MMVVAALIGIMIAVVVGVSLIPTLTHISSTLTNQVVKGNSTTDPTAVSSLINVLPFIFIAVIILGAIAWMGTHIFGGSSEGGELGHWTEEDEDEEEREEKAVEKPVVNEEVKEVIAKEVVPEKNWLEEARGKSK